MTTRRKNELLRCATIALAFVGLCACADEHLEHTSLLNTSPLENEDRGTYNRAEFSAPLCIRRDAETQDYTAYFLCDQDEPTPIFYFFSVNKSFVDKVHELYGTIRQKKSDRETLKWLSTIWFRKRSDTPGGSPLRAQFYLWNSTLELTYDEELRKPAVMGSFWINEPMSRAFFTPEEIDSGEAEDQISIDGIFLETVDLEPDRTNESNLYQIWIPSVCQQTVCPGCACTSNWGTVRFSRHGYDDDY